MLENYKQPIKSLVTVYKDLSYMNINYRYMRERVSNTLGTSMINC